MDKTDPQESPARPQGRIPLLAVAVVVVGLIASAGMYVLSAPEAASPQHSWSVVQQLPAYGPKPLGRDGSLQMARTSVTALAPNPDNSLLFHVAGIVTLDTGGDVPTELRCAVNPGRNAGTIARTVYDRAAWPRPGDKLVGYPVPDPVALDFGPVHGFVYLPTTDTFRRFADSTVPISVDWSGSDMKRQSWVWKLPQGSGDGSVILGYAVIYRTFRRPEWSIGCRATTRPGSGPHDSTALGGPIRIREWPIEIPTGPPSALRKVPGK